MTAVNVSKSLILTALPKLLAIAIVVASVSVSVNSFARSLGEGSIGDPVLIGTDGVESHCSIEKSCADGTKVECSASGKGAACRSYSSGPDGEYLQCSQPPNGSQIVCCFKGGGGGDPGEDLVTNCGKFKVSTQ